MRYRFAYCIKPHSLRLHALAALSATAPRAFRPDRPGCWLFERCVWVWTLWLLADCAATRAPARVYRQRSAGCGSPVQHHALPRLCYKLLSACHITPDSHIHTAPIILHMSHSPVIFYYQHYTLQALSPGLTALPPLSSTHLRHVLSPTTHIPCTKHTLLHGGDNHLHFLSMCYHT